MPSTSRPKTQSWSLPGRGWYYETAKRVMDIALFLLSLPTSVPLLILCALAIRLDSPGPAVFFQERVGKGGHLFRMYIFRTMHHGLDDSSHREIMRAYVRGETGISEFGARDDFRGAFVWTDCGENGGTRLFKAARAFHYRTWGRLNTKPCTC